PGTTAPETSTTEPVTRPENWALKGRTESRHNTPPASRILSIRTPNQSRCAARKWQRSAFSLFAVTQVWGQTPRFARDAHVLLFDGKMISCAKHRGQPGGRPRQVPGCLRHVTHAR